MGVRGRGLFGGLPGMGGWMDGWMSKSVCRHEEVDPSHLGGAVWCGAGIGGVEGAAAVDWLHR